MTEDEAKTKWCPFARVLDWNADSARQGDEPQLVGAAVNRSPADVVVNACTCIGSKCMAWRKRGVAPTTAGGKLQEMGFCGLAGDPDPLVVCGPSDGEVRMMPL